MNTRFPRSLALLGGFLLAVGFASAASAQSRSPVDRIGQLFGRSTPDDEDLGAPRVDSGAAVRIDRLENQVRTMTGQIEQMQFTVRQLQDQLRKFQGDMDFRLQESSGASSGAARPPVRRSEEGLPPVVAQTTPPLGGTAVTTPGTGEPTRLRRGDAFDPTLQPNAPGVPRPIGTLPGANVPSTPVAQSTRLPTGLGGGESGAPMDLSGGRMASASGIVDQTPRTGAIVGTPLPSAGGAPGSSAPASFPPGASPVQPGAITTPGGTVIASREAFSPKDEFDMATGYLKGGQYEAAEKGYATFLQKNPKNRLVPEAVYNLGESYFQRGRHREAAEQYLKIAQTYTTWSRAPDAMLRLGQSLGAMGAKDQACAAFRDAAQKYPSATSTVKASADREAKKNSCGA